MKITKLFQTIIFLLCITIMVSCGAGGGGGGVTIEGGGSHNQKVIANAGADQVGSINIPIMLDGSGSSTDGSGDLTYLWEFAAKPLGSTAELSTPTSAKTSFICDVPGSYIVKLVVTNQGVNSTPDSVTINAFAPIANAGPNQLVSTGATVTLDGSGSAYSGTEELHYNWIITSRPEASNASIFDPTAIKPIFLADVSGLYEISLLVSNGIVNSTVDTVTVKATTVPVANAGADQTVSTGTTVALDGRASSTSDGAALTYKWSFSSKPITSNAALSALTSSLPTFKADVKGTYTISLVVKNGWENSAEDRVTISATPPVANAGADQKVSTGMSVTLDGSGSTDPNGAHLTLSWTIKSMPVGSTATLSNPASLNPSITVDKEGTYVIGLIVNNGTENSVEDTVTVAATTPVANAGTDQKVSTGSTIKLDGSGSKDANGYSLKYYWSIKNKPTGSAAMLNDSIAVKPTLIADIDGVYEMILVVNNGYIDSKEDSVSITSTTAPVANAGADKSVSLNEKVTLSGSDSSDYHGVPLTYSWTMKSIPAGSSAALSGRLTVNPFFTPDKVGDYVIALKVNNGTEESSEDTITVKTSLPVADAGPSYNITPGSTVILDGRGSSDVNGYPLTYKWAVVTSPVGSTPTISDSASVTPSFSANMVGAYQLSLIVNNGFVDSITDSIVINVRISVGNNSGVFSTDFEDPNENLLWSVSQGVWEIGTPTSGPNVAYIGSNVAATVLAGNYPGGTSSSIESPSIQLPSLGVGQEIQLSFWHWFSLSSCSGAWSNYVDYGIVQISEQISTGVWSSPISLKSFAGYSGEWSRVSIDLSGYAGKKVRVGFLLSNSGRCNPAPGWYIDEVLIEVR